MYVFSHVTVIVSHLAEPKAGIVKFLNRSRLRFHYNNIHVARIVVHCMDVMEDSYIFVYDNILIVLVTVAINHCTIFKPILI